jgi:molybdate transport system substrate-binding protein
MVMSLAKLRAVAICLTLLIPAGAARAAEKITVFAAASLTDALNAIDEDYTKRAGQAVTASFAASSTLARQIEAGAPAQVFVSADAKWMDYLAGKQLIVSASRVDLLGNRLALIAPSDSPSGPVAVGLGLDWDRLLGPDGRLAVGDPAHVPAGLYARDALERLGQWQHLAPRLARADDVRGALALVERGDAPLGIVYVTDARISPRVKILGVFPDSSHAPIVYPAALVAGTSSPAAEAYLRYLRGPAARAVFARYGFLTP